VGRNLRAACTRTRAMAARAGNAGRLSSRRRFPATRMSATGRKPTSKSQSLLLIQRLGGGRFSMKASMPSRPSSCAKLLEITPEARS